MHRSIAVPQRLLRSFHAYFTRPPVFKHAVPTWSAAHRNILHHGLTMRQSVVRCLVDLQRNDDDQPLDAVVHWSVRVTSLPRWAHLWCQSGVRLLQLSQPHERSGAVPPRGLSVEHALRAGPLSVLWPPGLRIEQLRRHFHH